MKLTHIQKHNLEMTAFWSIAIIFFGAIVYFSWYFGRQINYNLSYQDMVIETICETVKPEALINPTACEAR